MCTRKHACCEVISVPPYIAIPTVISRKLLQVLLALLYCYFPVDCTVFTYSTSVRKNYILIPRQRVCSHGIKYPVI